MRMQTAVVTKVACRNAYEYLLANSLAFIASRCSPQARHSPRARGADQLARVGARPSTPVARPALLRPAQKHPTSGSPETVEPTARPACASSSRVRSPRRSPAAAIGRCGEHRRPAPPCRQPEPNRGPRRVAARRGRRGMRPVSPPPGVKPTAVPRCRRS